MATRLALLLMTGLLLACNGAGTVNAEAASPGQLPARLGLQFDTTVTWANLELRWLDFEDSRCAIGVNCVWAGRMAATVEVQRGTERREILLSNNLKSEPPAASAFGYAFRLLGMEPHPKQGVDVARSARTLEIGIQPEPASASQNVNP